MRNELVLLFVIIVVGAAAGYGACSLWQSFYPGTSPSQDTVTDDRGISPVTAVVNLGPEWESLVAVLKHEEGLRLWPYKDSRGFDTIGYGTRLPFIEDDRDCFRGENMDSLAEKVQQTSRYLDSSHDQVLNWNKVIVISTEQSDCLLRSRLSTHYIDLMKRWEPLLDKPVQVQIALIDMAYQLGVDGLLGFHEMLADLARHDYAGAIREAIDSAWDSETPSRVDRVVSVFRSQEKGPGG